MGGHKADSKTNQGPRLRVLPGGASDRGPSRGSPGDPSREPDPLDFDAVFRRYAPYVASIAFKILGRDVEIDDVVQEVFCIAHRSMRRLRDPAALKSWLGRIAVRRAQRRLRRGFWRRKCAELAGVDGESLVDPQATPEQRAEVASVYRALQQLPAPQRVAWVLRHVEGEGLVEVAALCGCSLSTVQRRLTAATQFMERALRDG